MSTMVLIGYKDSEGEYCGFMGDLKMEEYGLLKRLSEECSSLNVLSDDELKSLSDAKDLLAKARIKLYELERGFSEAEKRRLNKVNRILGETLESFDIYRKDAPQLDFLLSFCIIDASYSEINEKDEYESNNFYYLDMTEEDSLLHESVDGDMIRYIDVSEEFVNVISEWIEEDGRRAVKEAIIGEEDWGTMETEIDWWKDNMRFFEEKLEFNLTTMIFRSLRNNVLKCKRTGNPILSSTEWPKRIEIL